MGAVCTYIYIIHLLILKITNGNSKMNGVLEQRES